MADVEELLPRMLSRRYRLDAKLGQGGMGVVYRALDLAMERPVAVKLIRAQDGIEIDEEGVGRFLREAKNTARIQHEHIIEVFDLGRSDRGEMYFVMELLEGESLAARLRRDGRLEPDPAVHVTAQICAALEVAHTAGIVHRDLKPANIMLVPRAGDALFVKVLDFGVAKSTAPDQQTALTRAGMLVGTVEYMAPEQIMGKGVDARTDVYALGVLLYRTLAGSPVFKDTGVPAMINNHLNALPEPLPRRAPDAGIPPALDRVVQRCLAKRPDARYGSMREVGLALREALDRAASLPSLEATLDENDPYGSWGKTEVAAPTFDDASVVTRAERVPRAAPVPPAPEPDDFDDDDVATRVARSAAPASPAARRCAVCSTDNPSYARVCGSCGVSLDPAQPIPMSSSAVANVVQGYSPPQIAYPLVSAPAPRPLSAWQRVLSWAGLRKTEP